MRPIINNNAVRPGRGGRRRPGLSRFVGLLSQARRHQRGVGRQKRPGQANRNPVLVVGRGQTARVGAVAGANMRDERRSTDQPGTEKRQHGWVTVSKPLDRGAVRVKVKFPWLECKVGAAFPDAVLQNDAGRYEFQDAIITGCAPDSVTLDYAKVTVRGWDPATK